MALPQKSVDELGPGQYHLAVAGGSTIRNQNNRTFTHTDHSPTRYREVVLTRSNIDCDF